jgi:hypothetical protein
MPCNDSSDPHTRDLARTTTIVLAEFAALRTEITERITLLVTLILGNLTVLGVVFGIALSQSSNKNVPGTNVPTNRTLLLLLPVVTPCIGVLVIDHFRNMDLLGRYIVGFIRPNLAIDDEHEGVFNWERWAAGQTSSPWFWGPFQFVLFVEFLGPPIAVLAYAFQYDRDHPQMQVGALQISLWWAGAVLTGFLLLYALCYGIYSEWHSQGARKTRLRLRGGDAGEPPSGKGV